MAEEKNDKKTNKEPDLLFFPGQGGQGQPVAPEAPVEQIPLYEQGQTAVPADLQETAAFPDRVAPVEETSGWKKALATLGYTIPGPLGTPFIAPYFLSEQKISGQKANDDERIALFSKILEEDPTQAGELLNNPIFSEPIMRRTQASGKDITNLSYTLTHKKLTPDEKIRLIGAGGMLDEQENIVPRPYAAESDIAYKKEMFDNFKNAYQSMPKNKNRDKGELDVETYMAYNALDAKKGRQGNRYTLGTAQQNWVIVDQDDPNPDTAFHRIPTGALKKYKYAWVEDEAGMAGFVMLPESLDPTMDPSDVPVIFKDAAQFLSENGVSPDMIRSISGDRRKLMEKIGDLIREIDPNFDGWLPDTIPGEEVASGDVQAPKSIMPKGKTKLLGPATNQGPEPDLAEKEANQYY